uniref:Protein kinase domain-containing protein n=1 Tax=Noctiluca scintillans TaxID=2966 RepID=A0A7S1AM46_NOCSC|mmetsp:Transcript_52021/g.138665  ORF Transcript_52021/g.138665 Transcript_52021/m.138665 type:complete len:473 (+) Transcript_52021:76-1494(+)
MQPMCDVQSNRFSVKTQRWNPLVPRDIGYVQGKDGMECSLRFGGARPERASVPQRTPHKVTTVSRSLAAPAAPAQLPAPQGASQPCMSQASPVSVSREVLASSNSGSDRVPTCMIEEFDDLLQEPPLGHGAFAQIFRIEQRSSRKPFAMKVMVRSWFAARNVEDLIASEINGMARCSERGACRHVVRLLESAEENDRVFLRMELCHSSLLIYLRGCPNYRIEEPKLAPWATQLCLGLMDIHAAGILHRDIKPENFRFRDTRTGELVLLDFGLSTVSEPANVIRTRVGTMAYAAPEVHTRRYGTAADVWSIGVMLYVMLTGCVPFEYSDAEMLAGVCDAVTPKDVIKSLDIWELSIVSAPARCLLRSLLVHDARDRWTAVEALQHQWFHVEDALPWTPCARRKSKFLDVDKCAYRSAFDITRKLPDLKAEPTSLRNHTAPGSLPETEVLRRRRPACLVCFKGFVEIVCLLCLS